MANPTPTQVLASLLIGQPIGDWITAKRAEGVTWRQMARDLREATDDQIDITGEALRLWHEEVAA